MHILGLILAGFIGGLTIAWIDTRPRRDRRRKR